MTTIIKIWNILGSMRGAVYLLAGVSALFFVGSVHYTDNSEIFAALNTTMLFDWLGTFGLESFGRTWWFFLLLVVLFLLGVNTCICTLERTVRIIRLRNRRSLMSFLILFSPHIMHIAFLVIMAGYFALYTGGVNSYNNILTPGFQRPLPGSSVIMELRDPSFAAAHHQHNESLNGLHVAAIYTLVFHDGNETETRKIGINSPCFYKGYSIHVADFNPQRTISMTKNVWVNLTIRKNMGIPLFMIGITIFACGVILYTLSVFTNKQ